MESVFNKINLLFFQTLRYATIMGRRTDILTSQNIKHITVNNPFMLLFQKQDWDEYLELTAQIYDVLENQGSDIEWSQVESLIENFYASKPPAYVIHKKGQFMSMAIAELGILKDSHDARGNRYIQATKDGKNLLKFCETLTINRKKFTGTGADTLLGALNNLLIDQNSFTKQQAIAHHKEKIKEYKNDIERIKKNGVQAAQHLTLGFSTEELLTQADKAASYILSAGEDIKLSIQNARKTLIQKYSSNNSHVGKSITFIADYYDTLRQTPEYMSFIKAKNILSHIQEISGKYPQKDIPQILYRLTEKNIIKHDELKNTCLLDFSKQFQNIVHSIEEKVQEQINLLRIQVHYAITGDSKRIRTELNQCLSTLTRDPQKSLKFLSDNPFRTTLGLKTVIGTIKPHDLVIESKEVTEKIKLNTLNQDEMTIIYELLKKADEVTIAKVIQLLKNKLSRHGSVVLSRYEWSYGILEYYVLSCIDYFTADIDSCELGLTDLCINTKTKNFIIQQANDKKFFFKKESTI